MTIIADSARVAEEFDSAFSRVWETSIGLPIRERPDITPDHAPYSAGPAWFGSVAWIGGSWTGNVTLAVEPAIASAISKAMLGGAQPSEAEITDALREVANMVAGNVKSTIPGICGLATPGSFRILTGKSDPVQDVTPLVVRWMESEHGLIRVSLGEMREARSL
jgi:Chemotaxis phosphatase CheX